MQKQIQYQTELLEMQGAQIQQLADILGKGGGNLLEVQAAASGTFPHRDDFVPTLEMVENQVNHVCQLDNETLANLAIGGDSFAHRERLLREIMQVDRCSWNDAHDKLIEMDEFNERFYWIQTLPYRVGISLAFAGGVGSILLVFCKPTAQFYAEHFAGEGLPEGVEDISTLTTNQVGSWTWEWAEPMIGVASFALLCMQFARAQAVNMNMSAYTRWMLHWRAHRAELQYPRYSAAMVRSWAAHLPRVDVTFMPHWKRTLYTPEARKKNFRALF